MAYRELRHKHRRTPASVKQEADDDSDVEETQLGLRPGSQVIHSGHFMVSSPHSEHPPKKGYDFDTVNKQTCQTYRFGKASMSHLSIDASLTKLFECMTLAYSGKLVSPKWKNFKGLKLLWRDKIRLNNAIWRAWYMQYVERRENPVCHFVTPLDGHVDMDVHRPAEAVASDGRNWKRRIEIVIREYHKWRTYFKKRLQKHKDDDLSSLLKGPEEQLLLFGEVSPDILRVSFCQDEETASRRGAAPRKLCELPAPMEMEPLFDMDVLMSEFSDTLFSTLASHQPIGWPNPREIAAHAGNADMIQPGLISLQPNLDFMDSFDPLQDLFHSLRQPPSPSVPPTLPSSSCQSQQVQFLSSNPIAGPALQPIAGPALQPSRRSERTYVQSYVSLYSDPAGVSSAPQELSSASSVGPAHRNPPSSVDESDTPTTFSRCSELSSVSSQTPPPAPQLQPLASGAPGFAMPCLFQPPSANKSRPVQRIAPASAQPSSQLILTALFPGHPSTMIVTPTPLSADITPSHLVATSSFQVVPRAQKSPQPIVPKERSSSPKSSPGDPRSPHLSAPPQRQGSPLLLLPGDAQRGSGPGSPCGSEQVLVKMEQNQSRRGQVSAEQKRRSNINIGFKTLHELVPPLKNQPNISNAVTLQKSVDYIGKLQQERQQLQEEVRRLREEIEELNASISSCQEQLPASGAPVRRHRFDHMQDKFNEYVKSRTLHNWKFWINQFSVIIKPLFESFNGTVSTSSRQQLFDSTLQWVELHCSLPVLRPVVLSSLRQLSTSTSILSNPSVLPEEALQAVTH